MCGQKRRTNRRLSRAIQMDRLYREYCKAQGYENFHTENLALFLTDLRHMINDPDTFKLVLELSDSYVKTET